MASLAIIIIAITVFAVSIFDVSTSSADTPINQFLINKRYNEALRRQAEFWKKLDADMDHVRHGLDKQSHHSSPGAGRSKRRYK
jgi:hypothetical protein